MKKLNGYKMDLMHGLLSSTQMELLHDKLPKLLAERNYNDVELIGDCLFAHGNIPVMLVAHCDLVQGKSKEEAPQEFVYAYEKNNTVLSAFDRTLGADDRSGIYIILETINDLLEKNIRPFVLFTSDEEKGCIGASKFTTKMPSNEYEIKFVVELDRRGSNDAVFYDCDDDKEFVNFILEKTGYRHALGSYSDIVEISDAWGVCSCNLSCGYYSEHTQYEYLVIEEMMNTKKVLTDMLANLDYNELPTFTHTPIKKNYGGFWSEQDYYYPYEDCFGEDMYDVDGYTVCADCGALVPYDDSHIAYGIPLCSSCKSYYDDVISTNLYDDDELEKMDFADDDCEKYMDEYLEDLYSDADDKTDKPNKRTRKF